MSDNLQVTPGSGATVAADLIGGALHQRVKISVGADGVADDWEGKIGTFDDVITITPTLDTAAYASGDLLFDSTEIANAVRVNGGCAIIQSITIIDKDDQGISFTLLIANTNTDFGTLNSPPDPDDAEVETVIGHIPVTAIDYIDLGGAKVACLRNIGLLIEAGGATTSLYMAAVNGTSTPTFSASGLVLQIGLLRS